MVQENHQIHPHSLEYLVLYGSKFSSIDDDNDMSELSATLPWSYIYIIILLDAESKQKGTTYTMYIP